MNTQERSGKIPTFLLVLLILTSIHTGFGLFDLLTSIGDPPPDDLSGVIEEVIYGSNTDLSQLPDWLMPELMSFVGQLTANYGLINAMELAYFLLLAPAIVLMFNLKRIGYYIYVCTQVFGVAYIPFLYGSNTFSWFMVALFSTTTALFIILYTMNYKHLR